MKDKKTLEIALFLRFSARKRENICHDIESVFELFDNGLLADTLPIHWNLPVHPLLTGSPEDEEGSKTADGIVEAIRHRAAGNNDVIVPMGYAGAYHGLLTDEEMRQEVEWAYRNPNKTGFEDRMRLKPKLMMPAQMDFLRPAARSFYNNSSLVWISAPHLFLAVPEGQIITTHMEILDHGNMYFFPLICTPRGMEEIGKPFKKICRKESGPLAVLFDFTTGNKADEIASFFDAVEKIRPKINIKFISIHRWLLPDRRQDLSHPEDGSGIETRIPGTMLPLLSFPHDPAHRSGRFDGGRKRFFIRRQEIGPGAEEYREKILISSGICKNSESLERPPRVDSCKTPVERTLIADMPGTVVIKEHNFEAEFRNGRFTNIIAGTRPVLAGIPARSYLDINGSRYEFESAGVYSFESEEVRGLRETLLVCTPFTVNEGKLVIDYMFIEEYPGLFISADIQYPEFNKQCIVDAHAPLELSLFTCGHHDTAAFSGFYPDGTNYSSSLPCAEHVYDFPAQRFLINREDAAFTMSFPPIQNIPVEIIPVKIGMQKQKKESLVSINPKGSYRPADARFLSGFSEHFTLMISAVYGEPRQNPIPYSVLEQLQEYWLGIITK